LDINRRPPGKNRKVKFRHEDEGAYGEVMKSTTTKTKALERERELKALMSLSEAKLVSHLSLILERLNDEDASVRWKAVEVIGKLPPAERLELIPMLRERISSPIWQERQAAVQIMGQLPMNGLSSLVPEIRRVFLDEEEGVRRSAVRSITQLSGEEILSSGLFKEWIALILTLTLTLTLNLTLTLTLIGLFKEWIAQTEASEKTVRECAVQALGKSIRRLSHDSIGAATLTLTLTLTLIGG